MSSTTEKPRSSYSDILKSSSIIGGSQGANYLISLVQVKLVAIFIGPAGTGLVGFYQSILGLVQSIVTLGINQSAVRDMAEATQKGDETTVNRTANSIIQILFFCGLLGWLGCIVFARELSERSFGSDEHRVAIMILGSALIFSVLTSSFQAILQGIRKISVIGKISLYGGPLNAIIAITLYWWLRDKGYLPVIILTAAANCFLCYYFYRKVAPERIRIPWRETLATSRRLLLLGLVFMWTGLLAAASTFAIRFLILRDFGLEANGIYQAAWAISGMFAGFILGAMGVDFYPRLTQAAHDSELVNRLANEQTEIGVLCALPGLVGSLIFAPWILPLLFSSKFTAASALLPWFIIGVFGRIVSWPMGYILLAKNAKSAFTAVETGFTLAHLAACWALMKFFNLKGVALAFPLAYALYTLSLFFILNRHTRFRWSRSSMKLILLAILLILAAFGTYQLESEIQRYGLGFLLTLLSGYIGARGIVSRLGPDNRLVRRLYSIPGVKYLC